MTETGRGIDLVLKLGGGLLAHPDYLIDSLERIASAAQRIRLVIVPGGGPFADMVRQVDRDFGLGDDEAHWMAVLAMDQYAHLLAARVDGGVIVQGRDEMNTALDAGRIPILAPYRWLREVDPLPHAWDITSDSIAAWIAGALEAARLVLVKPPDAEEPLVDAYFTHALPRRITPAIVGAGKPLQDLLEAYGRVRR